MRHTTSSAHLFSGISFIRARSDIATASTKLFFDFFYVHMIWIISIRLLCGWHNSSWIMWFESVRRQMNCEWSKIVRPIQHFFCCFGLYFYLLNTIRAKVRLALNIDSLVCVCWFFFFRNFAIVTFHLPTIFKWNGMLICKGISAFDHNACSLEENWEISWREAEKSDTEHRTGEKKQTTNKNVEKNGAQQSSGSYPEFVGRPLGLVRAGWEQINR